MSKLKICGLKTKEDVEIINETQPDYCGFIVCLLYTSPSPRDAHESRMPSSA